MRIGITFDLKTTAPTPSHLPDDHQEEFDSPHTIEAIAAVLRGMGHQVVFLGDGREFLEKVLAEPPDLVFNFAEGTGVSRSREARVPAVLEMLGIPFTGSDPLTCAVTLDKDCAKKLVAAAGVATPRSVLVSPLTAGETAPATDAVSFPAIVKPAWEGSSKGIRNKSLVNNRQELIDVLASLGRDHPQPILVEEYIEGHEVTVGMLGNDTPIILGVMRIVPEFPVERFVYSLEVKREYKKLVRYECPPALPAGTLSQIEEAAHRSFAALGCRDVARIDFRLRDGVPYFLEVNPLPGLNPEDSDLVILAKLAGWSYAQLVESIVGAALKRLNLS